MSRRCYCQPEMQNKISFCWKMKFHFAWNFIEFSGVVHVIRDKYLRIRRETLKFDSRYFFRKFQIKFSLFLCVSGPSESIAEVSKNFMKFNCDISFYKVSWNFASLMVPQCGPIIEIFVVLSNLFKRLCCWFSSLDYFIP